MDHLEIQNFRDGSLNVLDAWVTKFQYLITVNTNQVVVLLKTIRLFELSKVFSKLMFGHQITFHQQIQGIVNRGSTYPVVFIFHTYVEALYIKMARSTVNLL
jgi:hypothetical protein